MLPAITPPTDNLYKFISLFGLTIFLFSMYNLGIVYDQSAASQMEIEDVKSEVLQGLYGDELPKGVHYENNGYKRFRPAKISAMDKNLERISLSLANAIDNRAIDFSKGTKLTARINKINVKLDAMSLKLWLYICVLCLGFLVMVFGFWRWKKREQDLRDNMLLIEHAMKEREKAGMIGTETTITSTTINQRSTN
jgi:hypothetical protein